MASVDFVIPYTPGKMLVVTLPKESLFFFIYSRTGKVEGIWGLVEGGKDEKEQGKMGRCSGTNSSVKVRNEIGKVRENKGLVMGGYTPSFTLIFT